MDDQRAAAPLAVGPEKLQSVDPRHPDVTEDEVEGLGERPVERPSPVVLRRDLVARIPQQQPQGLTQSGLVVNDAGQSGQPRVDNNAGSAGHGWIYLPYASLLDGGTFVATADSNSYQLPTDWQQNKVTSQGVTSFSQRFRVSSKSTRAAS